LGREVFGTWVFLEAFFTMILTFDLGLGIANEKEIAAISAKKNVGYLTKFLFTLLCFQLLVGCLLAGGFVLLISSTLNFFKFSSALKDQIYDLRLVLFFLVLFIYITNNFLGIIRGLQKHYLIMWANFAYVIFRVALIIYWLPKESTMKTFAVISFLSFAFEMLILGSIILSILKVKVINLRFINIPMSFINVSKNIFLLQLLAVMVFSSGKIILGAVVAAASIAYFEIGLRFFSLVRNVIDSIARVFLPIVADMNARQEKEKIKKVLNRGSYYLFYIWTLMAFPLLFVIKDFVRIWLGDDFFKAIPVIQLFVISTGFITLTRISVNIFIAKENMKAYVKTRAVFAVLYFFASIILANKYGIYGPAIAMLLYAMSSEVYLFYYSAKTFNLSLKPFFSSICLRIFLPNSLCLALLSSITRIFPLTSYQHIFCVALIYCLTSILMFWYFGIEKKEQVYFVNKLMGKRTAPQ